ncbi:hypothetical protein KBP51_06715 [Lactiplantibacillus pentosus]|uniref:hypothetical protein n=1 Tax=Lactiplantibacillus pentosus TaxID=1589 RepID=UPI001B391726|nr:hypothetical protein [Lactiplantibacillus pentosus]MBQ0836157.1 hypothetical protein [Lactiplantibacillus pentosus]
MPETEVYLIMTGYVEETPKQVGVVAAVYVSTDLKRARSKLATLRQAHPQTFYELYHCPLDTELDQLSHYPSVEFSPADFT